jgi:hypothetical protein
MPREENNIGQVAERRYNVRDAVKALRSSVEATSDREELRVADSQLRQLLAHIREKMRGRKAR